MTELGFLVYLTSYRLGLIAVGGLSILLGYRLFTTGRGETSGSGAAGTELDATLGKSKLTLKNAAPGTCFAAFGALIISVMLVNQPPELELKTENDRGQSQTIRMRGKQGQEADPPVAAREYQETVGTVHEALNETAWAYHKAGRDAEALPFARVAVKIRPDDAVYLDTLAEVLYNLAVYGEALEHMQKAADLAPRYRKKLPRFQEAVQ